MGLFSKKTGIFQQFLFSYLFVLVFAFVLLVPIYRITIDSVKERAITEINHRLESGIESFNTSILSVNKAMYNLLLNQDVRKIISVDNIKPIDYYNMTRAQRQLRGAIEPFQIINNAFLFIKNNNISISMDSIYDDRNTMYYHYIQYDNMEEEEWMNAAIDDCKNKTFLPEAFVSIQGNTRQEVITYFLTFSQFNTTKYDSSICVLLEKDSIVNLLTTNEVYKNGWLYIQDVDKNMILTHNYNERPLTITEKASSFVTEIDNKETVVFYKDVYDTGMRIVLGLPVSSYAEDINKARNLIIIYCFIALFLGSMVSLLLSYFNSKPVFNIISLIENKGIKESSSEDEYGRIHRAIEGLFQSKESLYQQIENDKKGMLTGVFERLLHTGVYLEEDLELAKKHIGFLPERYTIANIKIKNEHNDAQGDDLNSKKLEVYRTLLVAVLRERFFDKEYIHITGNSSIVVLVKTAPDTNAVKSLNMKLEEAQKRIYNDFKIITFCGISNIHEGIHEIFTAFSESETALDCINGTPFISKIQYGEINSGEYDFWMDITDNTKLFQMLIAGEKQNVTELLAVIYSRSHKKILENVKYAMQLYYTLRGIIISAGRETGQDMIIRELPNYVANKTIIQNFDVITEQMNIFCDRIQERQRSRNYELKDSILSYIHENYGDLNLFAKPLSERFGVSEKYMYQLVKERTGMSLSSYIEQIRLEEAKKKILNTDKAISTIALSCGYASPNTFYKAFKRVHGVSPNNWRSLQQSKNTE